MAMERKLIAIVMIILAVFTVFGTVAVTAKPATAAPMSDPFHQVKAGHWAAWVGPLFNVHGTKFDGSTPQHAEISKGAKLATTMPLCSPASMGRTSPISA